MSATPAVTSSLTVGRYEVTRPMPPAPLPTWLNDLARQPGARPVSAVSPPRPINDGSAYGNAALAYEAENVARTAEGTRNSTLFKSRPQPRSPPLARGLRQRPLRGRSAVPGSLPGRGGTGPLDY